METFGGYRIKVYKYYWVGLIMETIVVDSVDIFIVSVEENINENRLLTAYLKMSNVQNSAICGQKKYAITQYSQNIYSVNVISSTTEHRGIGLILTEIDIAGWWAMAYPIIEQIANVTGTLTGVATIASAPFLFVKWLRKEIKTKNSNNEYKWIKIIIDKDEWNISSLATMIALPKNQVKNILKGFGYIWDSHRMLYIASENTKKMRIIKPKYKLK